MMVVEMLVMVMKEVVVTMVVMVIRVRQGLLEGRGLTGHYLPLHLPHLLSNSYYY